MAKYPLKFDYAKPGTIELKCKRCGKPFWVIPSQVKYLKTCSPECHHPPPMETFMAKVVKRENGCWIYTGTPGSSGYGNVKVNGKQYRAARLSWELHKGDPGNAQVNHHCDTPLCVNPDHLELGSQQENIDAMMERGRHKNGGKGEKCNFAKLTTEQARYIKGMKGKKTAYELLAEFPNVQLTPSAIWSIWARRTWKHL